MDKVAVDAVSAQHLLHVLTAVAADKSGCEYFFSENGSHAGNIKPFASGSGIALLYACDLTGLEPVYQVKLINRDI